MISPKLVEVGRHLNIELITYADLQSVEGSPGNFKVKVRKKARSIHMDLCTGCGACVDNCPVLYQAAN
ncbi:MAG: 4Fe-4S dicluster domain-containing protein [Desulfobacteraceae bacterium]|nr:4Fe-4S dicluster domain-containing protein [Desulfobacteraceae bacterium]